MQPGPELQSIREEIEQLDSQLLSLLRQRMIIVEKVATTKLLAASPFRDQQREEAVLQRVRKLAVDKGLDARGIERIYRLIMEMSISHQQAHIQGLPTVPLKVAYQGVEGSYSHLTAQRRYIQRSGGALLSGFATVRETIRAVRDGVCDVALLPIENSTAGSINETYDALAEGGLTINAEELSRVEHCLIGLPGTRIEDLRRVISHPQAIAQCETFLNTVPWVRPYAEFDTAGSVNKVKEGNDPAVAAIASSAAAKLFGLEVLAAGIQMQAGNATRFVEISIEGTACPADVDCKTSMVFSVDHSAGALGEVLSEFGRRGIQLAKIESRPMQTDAWKYRFYIDVEEHADSESMVGALEKVRQVTNDLRLLGTYPRAAAAATIG